jgi:hypothetical protein
MNTCSKLLANFSLAALSVLGFYSCKDSDDLDDHLIPDQKVEFVVPDEKMGVDMGLSVKWAPFNVGASKPTEYGNYYAWGEIEPKKLYTVDNYTVYDYSNELDIYGTNHDVAHVKWGSKWRMPTIEETLELAQKCTWEEVEIDGVKGMRVTGPSGNSIFLPAGGRRVDDRIEDLGSYGHYWQGSYAIIENVELYYYDVNQVIWGLSVRPVWAE